MAAAEGGKAESGAVAAAVEDAAQQQLGIEDRDRPGIYRFTAEAAADNRLPYWLVVALSGAIATLGLALNSSAVVIGAMLVAPLLAPVVGLSMALAVGEARLTAQAGAIVIGSTLLVVATAALLTALLPFHTITLEISARTRPSTLDLAIATFSGTVGAVVTVARGQRLSAAIPGVAIAVALIPPLAVAGFGIGIGWNWALIRGSMLLYGANLAGIVLSGMLVFLLVGMHQPEVRDAAARWHARAKPHGLAALAARSRWIDAIDEVRSPWARASLVIGFVIVLGVPLGETLGQIAREARVGAAVDDAVKVFAVPGRASVLGRRVDLDPSGTRVSLRVATTAWFGARERAEFERRASMAAGEPVRLTLEQIPAGTADLSALQELLAPEPQQPGDVVVPAVSVLAAQAAERLQAAAAGLALPDSVLVTDTDFLVDDDGVYSVLLTYASPAALEPQTQQILSRQLGRALDSPALVVGFERVPWPGEPTDTAAADTVGR